MLVANGSTSTLIDYQVGQKSSWPLSRTPLECFSRTRQISRAALRLYRRQPQRRLGARSRSIAIWFADARFPAEWLGARRAPALRMDGDRGQNRRTTVKLSDVRYNATVAQSAFLLHRTEEKIVGESFNLRPVHPAVRVARLDRSSILQVLGVSPCYPGRRIPCVTNAWSALAPCPRSGGLFHIGAVGLSEQTWARG